MLRADPRVNPFCPILPYRLGASHTAATAANASSSVLSLPNTIRVRGQNSRADHIALNQDCLILTQNVLQEV